MRRRRAVWWRGCSVGRHGEVGRGPVEGLGGVPLPGGRGAGDYMLSVSAYLVLLSS